MTELSEKTWEFISSFCGENLDCDDRNIIADHIEEYEDSLPLTYEMLVEKLRNGKGSYCVDDEGNIVNGKWAKVDIWRYDIWGNENDGYEVNDRWKIMESCPVILEETIFNSGTEYEFYSYSIPDEKIADLFGYSDSSLLNIEGDDKKYYVYLERSGRPIGEITIEE